MHLKIPVVRSNHASMPVQSTKEAAGFDLCAHIISDIVIAPGRRELVPTGLKMSIPEGFCGLVCPRSGLALRNGVTVLNAPGIIDSDYRGDIAVILANFGDVPFTIKAGMRVAQLVFVHHLRTLFVPAQSLDVTDRAAGGFGSTGAV